MHVGRLSHEDSVDCTMARAVFCFLKYTFKHLLILERSRGDREREGVAVYAFIGHWLILACPLIRNEPATWAHQDDAPTNCASGQARACFPGLVSVSPPDPGVPVGITCSFIVRDAQDRGITGEASDCTGSTVTLPFPVRKRRPRL